MVSDSEGKPLHERKTMTTTLQTKIADQIASVLLHTAEGNLAQTKAEAAERAGDTGATIDPANCWALRRGHPHARGFGDSINPPCHYLSAGEEPYICIPLEAQGVVLGIIHLLVDGGDSLDKVAANYGITVHTDAEGYLLSTKLLLLPKLFKSLGK